MITKPDVGLAGAQDGTRPEELCGNVRRQRGQRTSIPPPTTTKKKGEDTVSISPEALEALAAAGNEPNIILIATDFSWKLFVTNEKDINLKTTDGIRDALTKFKNGHEKLNPNLGIEPEACIGCQQCVSGVISSCPAMNVSPTMYVDLRGPVQN